MYLESLVENGDVVTFWSSAEAFWRDHAPRQKHVLPKLGKWSLVKTAPPRNNIQTYECYVRDLPDTIQHLIEDSVYLNVEDDSIEWQEHLRLHLRLHPAYVFNESGQRILTNWQSGDDHNNLVHALQSRAGYEDVLYSPFQLFIDKANVTRLNKRSMYPVILYLLCVSGKVRRLLAVNVAFIPIVGSNSKAGKELSSELVKKARITVYTGNFKGSSGEHNSGCNLYSQVP